MFGTGIRGRSSLAGVRAQIGGVAATVEYAGAAVQDPLGALMMCHAQRAKFVIVNGRVVVKYGQIATVNTQQLVTRVNDIVRKRFS